MSEISVIVPAYNVGDYLSECLDSLLAQTFTDFEAIIVDDGSSDATPVIIARYCEKDARFRVIRQPNRGVSAARNAALAQASGTYVCFLDGDDLYTPHALETLYRRAKQADADLVIGDYEIFDNLHAWGVGSMRTLLEKAEYDRFDENLLLCYVVWNKLFRRSVIAEHGLEFAPISFAEDSVFSMAFTYRSARIVTVDSVICRYRRRSYAAELSATQIITVRSETDHLEAHEGVRREAVAQLDRWISESDSDAQRERRERAKRSYLDVLHYREVANLVDLRYRAFWNAEDGVAALIADRVTEAREEMSYAKWSRLCRNSRDLPLAHLPRSRAELAERPLISVALYGAPGGDAELEQTLHSLYIQSFPRFQVFVPRDAMAQVGGVYATHENLRVVDVDEEAAFYNEVLEHAETEFVLFTRSGFLYRATALQRMFAALKNGNADLATFPVSRVCEEELPAVYPLQQLAFETTPDARDYLSDINHRFDCLLANKLVRRSYLDARSFSFTGDSVVDAERILRPACFIKSAHKVVHTPLRSEAFTKRFLGGRDDGVWYRWRVLAERTFGRTRRADDVLFLETKGKGFSQNLLSTRDAILDSGLHPRFLITTIPDQQHPEERAAVRERIKSAIAATGAVVCASDSLIGDAPKRRKGEHRLLLQPPRLNTVTGSGAGAQATADRYSDVVVQSDAFEATVRGALRPIGLPCIATISDAARIKSARSRLFSMRPDAEERTILVLDSDMSARRVFAGVDAAVWATGLAERGFIVVAAMDGVSELLGAERAELADAIFDAKGCFRHFDFLAMADVFVTTRFQEAVYRAASGRPVLFWRAVGDREDALERVPEPLRPLTVTSPQEMADALQKRPWETSAGPFVDAFVGSNAEGAAERVVELLRSKRL